MGIPSYFSYIVKNHANIIKKLNKLEQVDNFYLDSNSIIYDTLRQISKRFKNNSSFEKLLINETIKKLNEYISLISPKKTLIIAFDVFYNISNLKLLYTLNNMKNIKNNYKIYKIKILF